MANVSSTRGPFALSGRTVRSARLVAAVVVLGGLLLSVADASTASVAGTAGKFTFYADPSVVGAGDIASGPDGALWFTSPGNNSIGRITTTGEESDFTAASISEPRRIVAGPDGALWFTNSGNNSIGRITTAGAVTNFTGAGISQPLGITVGPDGALWFTNSGNDTIGRITTSGRERTYPGTGISNPNGIVSGPDGNLWFTNDTRVGSIGRMTTGGVVRNFASAGVSYPKQIAVGFGGALWFTTPNDMVWRITTYGKLTGFAESDDAFGISPGPGGALWVTGLTIGRVSTTGAFTSFTVPYGRNPYLITRGSDGAMWFTDWGGRVIGRITTSLTPAVNGFTPGSGAPGDQVTIRGSNLSGAAQVTFNGTAATIVSSDTRAVVTDVPDGATSGPVTVTTLVGTATSTQSFTVT